MAQRFLLNKLTIALKAGRTHWETQGFEDATDGEPNVCDRVPAIFRHDYMRGWQQGCTEDEKTPK